VTWERMLRTAMALLGEDKNNRVESGSTSVELYAKRVVARIERRLRSVNIQVTTNLERFRGSAAV
jgi:hypothetical protein